MVISKTEAQGRIDTGAPVAIVDIGSNSVRLVAYEGRTRAPTPRKPSRLRYLTAGR